MMVLVMALVACLVWMDFDMRYLKVKFFYLLRLTYYYLIQIMVAFIKILLWLHVGGDFFRTILAAHAYGVGIDAYQEKRYADAFNILKPIAEFKINDTYVGGCQFIFGLLYFYGLGVNKDNDLAIKYIERAKNNGDDEAKNFILRKK